jgi:hypothetical protein
MNKEKEEEEKKKKKMEKKRRRMRIIIIIRRRRRRRARTSLYCIFKIPPHARPVSGSGLLPSGFPTAVLPFLC